MKISKMIQMGAAALLLSSSAMADSVDLSSWAGTAGGNWNVQGTGNDSVLQSVNGQPTMFYNNQDSQGLALSGTIKAISGWDDDYIGFVLGYNDGDLNNSAADYILIDWKRGNQSGADRGLAISHVTGSIQNNINNDAWLHQGVVSELQRGSTLFDTGWVYGTEYTFDLIFTSSLIEVSVNGNTELSISGSFNNGSFGFYNYSQSNVLYAGIEENAVPAVPVPAALFMFAPALLGFMGLRRKAKLA
jgi:hypothetical protein